MITHSLVKITRYIEMKGFTKIITEGGVSVESLRDISYKLVKNDNNNKDLVLHDLQIDLDKEILSGKIQSYYIEYVNSSEVLLKDLVNNLTLEELIILISDNINSKLN